MEVVVSDGDLGIDLLGELEVRTQLRGIEVAVGAVELRGLVRGEVELGIEDREHAAGEEHTAAMEEFLAAAKCQTVEANLVGPGERGAEERIVETTHGEGDAVRERTAALILDEGAIKPQRILAEIAALAVVRHTKSLVLRDWRVVLTGADAEASIPVIVQVDVRSQTGAEFEAIAVLIDVVLRREDGASDIERSARVDGVEVRE